MSDLFGGALPIDLAAQRREVAREIALRRRVYGWWVAEGRLTQATADRQIAVMEAVLETLAQGGGRMMRTPMERIELFLQRLRAGFYDPRQMVLPL